MVSTDEAPPPPEPQSDDFLPPWAVAVIVIGLASVAFVIVFGVSMVSSEACPSCPSSVTCFSSTRSGRSCRDEARAGSRH